MNESGVSRDGPLPSAEPPAAHSSSSSPSSWGGISVQNKQTKYRKQNLVSNWGSTVEMFFSGKRVTNEACTQKGVRTLIADEMGRGPWDL